MSNLFKSPAWVFYAPKGTDIPDVDHEYAEAWPSPWLFLGRTMAETKWAFENPAVELMSEQYGVEMRMPSNQIVSTIETTIAQLTPESFALAFGGQVSTVATPSPHKVVEGGYQDTYSQHTFGIESVFPDGRPLRMQFYVCEIDIKGEFTASTGGQSGLPVVITSLPDTAKARTKCFWKAVFLNEAA